MASSTHQPVSDFYEWALKRYQRRAATLTRALFAVVVVALLLTGLFFDQVRQLRTQHLETRATVQQLEAELSELRSAAAQNPQEGANADAQKMSRRMTAYLNCLEAQSKRYAEGLARLLRQKISSGTFISNYKPKDCR